ncbi:MAG: hypothetical protein P1P76_02145 [Anaerolineales bacterium]|nr:hypothetical protein [Anaerolineales bacterium]
MNEINRSQKIYILPAIFFGMLALGLLIYFTRYGAGVGDDSVRYVMGARNLIAGLGYSRISGGGEIYPETGFAPLLSFMLAGVGLLQFDMYLAGRILNTIFYGANLSLLALLIFKHTRSGLALLVGSLLFISSKVIFEWHAWLMSEPLFIFLTLLSLYSLAEYIYSNSKRYLLIAALTAGAASITRYIGVSLIASNGLLILFFGKQGLRKRIEHAVLFGALSAAPFLLWMLRNQSLDAGGLANREIIFHPIRPEILRIYLFELTSWFIPERFVFPRIVRASIATVIAGLGPGIFLFQQLRHGHLRQRVKERPFASVPWLMIFYILFYVGVLAANSFLLDAGTTYDGAIRYLMPLLVMAIILEVTTYYSTLVQIGFSDWPGRLAVLYVGLVILFSAVQMFSFTSQSSLVLGFTGIRSRWSDVIDIIKAQEADDPIISNNPEMVYYLADRPAYMKPIKFDVYQRQEREDFPEQIELATERLRNGSIFVFFDEPSPEEEEILGILPVKPIYQTPRVTIYAYDHHSGSLRDTLRQMNSRNPDKRLT